ncbi:hypothetical protein Pint_13464 [Pistacia integerrima]|uniref:Uncharacterized protein n=1 Tax=Pistacia integerrima TaxID=434235 RepID=A0ACC0YAJ9_9ROSI|nr:hypothetical protein Pint_13464 [Pistacia integerrima]
MKPKNRLKKLEEPISFITRSNLDKACQEINSMCLLLLCEENEMSFALPEKVKHLFQEFSDVVPDEIPHGLPPMQDIQHVIYFILGLSFQNMKRRQVKQLLEKDLVRESVSPCAIPALLVPKKDGT